MIYRSPNSLRSNYSSFLSKSTRLLRPPTFFPRITISMSAKYRNIGDASRSIRFAAWLNAQARWSGRVEGQGSGIETLTGGRQVGHHQRARIAGCTCTFACNQLCRDVHRSRLWIRDSPCSGLLRHNAGTTWTQLPDRTCRPIYRTPGHLIGREIASIYDRLAIDCRFIYFPLPFYLELS